MIRAQGLEDWIKMIASTGARRLWTDMAWNIRRRYRVHEPAGVMVNALAIQHCIHGFFLPLPAVQLWDSSSLGACLSENSLPATEGLDF